MGERHVGLRSSDGRRSLPKMVLGRRASFWVSLAVSMHTLWTSAAPALSYRLYAEEWQLSPLQTTGVFAIYPLFVVGTLILLGDLSDHVGRRWTMLTALVFSLIGALTLAWAINVEWLLVARAAMGVGVGLASGASTAAILEFSSTGDPERAASATNLAQALGFATALLLGGALIQYAPYPLRLDFLALAVVIAALILAVWFLPRHVANRKPWAPRLPHVPTAIRRAFGVASLGAATAFATGAILLSLGGQVAHDLVGSANELTNGIILASFAIVSAMATIVARQLRPRAAFFFGSIATVIAMLLLWLATEARSLPALLVSTSSAGISYAFLFLGALTLLNAVAPVDSRGGVLSAFYLVGYLCMGFCALALGVVARAWGLPTAVAAAAIVLASLGGATFLFAAMRFSRMEK
ncbi:MFS transporter [Bradyrhizobium sp. INPA01-394B]|uniref:MFS transporter n=1 Tax=Bradyrhizobium campsiandrae TaxID=1729892 RepID=A0ABR7UEU7_9BRAD|nr:MFS transporter [Bradyrhizobium campsiandrae]MBC9881504.1 MFS transporter [Bradyrhizobium campsiandrae]MBC9982480.1 MFS transporter [Bradyrhizobium campsiandrae]